MVKLYLDANGLAPIAQALSGQSKLAGVAAGLRNQMLGAQLDEQRMRNDKEMQAQTLRDEMRGRFADNPNGLAALNAIQAFGGDGMDFLKGQNQSYDNNYRSRLGDLALAAAQAGDLARQNQAVAGYEGKMHSPYRADGYGQQFSQDTGAVQQTPASITKLGNIAANTNYQQAQTGLADARTQSEMLGWETEALRQHGLKLDNQGKVIKLNQSLNPQTGTAATKAPNADDARLFTSVDSLTGKPQVDYNRLNEAYLFAQQHGYASVSAALPAFGRWEQEKANITSRSGSDRLIEEAAALSQTARAVAGNGGATLVGQTLQSKYGQRINNKQSKDAAMRELQEAVANGFISQQAAGDLWEQMTGEK